RFSRDWSSDVCSSDLSEAFVSDVGSALASWQRLPGGARNPPPSMVNIDINATGKLLGVTDGFEGERTIAERTRALSALAGSLRRSEERRAGQEGRARG